MSENRIRRTTYQQPHGPAGAGVWVDSSNDALKYNPDGTTRDVGPVIFTLDSVVAASASKYFAVAPVDLELIDVRVTVTVNGSTGAQVEVVKGAAGTAVASGTAMSSAAALTGLTANTPVTTAALTTSARFVSAGQQIGIKLGGTLTNLAGGVITMRFRQN